MEIKISKQREVLSMIEQDGFLGIKFGQPLEIAHQRMTSEGYTFKGRGKSEAPIGRVVYEGRYLGWEAKIHLDFLRNGFHRSRVEIQAKSTESLQVIQKDLYRRYGPSERLSRRKQACTENSLQDPCFDVWTLDDDTSIVLDMAGTRDEPLIVLEYFRIL